MPTIYTPIITTRIPADIPVNKHSEINAKLDAARATLARRDSYNRAAALDMASVALHLSGCGACGVAGVSRKNEYDDSWKLSTIPRNLLRAEYAKTIKPPAPRARVELPCIQCAHPLSARERRKPCPQCGARQPRESST